MSKLFISGPNGRLNSDLHDRFSAICHCLQDDWTTAAEALWTIASAPISENGWTSRTSWTSWNSWNSCPPLPELYLLVISFSYHSLSLESARWIHVKSDWIGIFFQHFQATFDSKCATFFVATLGMSHTLKHAQTSWTWLSVSCRGPLGSGLNYLVHGVHGGTVPPEKAGNKEHTSCSETKFALLWTSERFWQRESKWQ